MGSPERRRGERSAPLPTPRRAAAAPARPAGLPLPSREKPAPLLRAPEEEGTVGKREKEMSRLCKRGGRSQRPRPGCRLRAPPAPGSAPPEATSGQQRPRRPPLGPAPPPSSGRAGKRGRSVRLRAAVPPKEAEAVTPLRLSYLPSLSTDLEKYTPAFYSALR